MEMNPSDQRSWYELAASRSAAHQGASLDAGGNLLSTSADEVDMFFPALDSSSNSRARYYQQVHHAAQMHSAYNSAAASHGTHINSISLHINNRKK